MNNHDALKIPMRASAYIRMNYRVSLHTCKCRETGTSSRLNKASPQRCLHPIPQNVLLLFIRQ